MHPGDTTNDQGHNTGAASTSAQPAADEQFCSECGAIIKRADKVCPHCGVRTESVDPSPSEKSRITYALLALFLGGLGIHKFYVGNTLWGVLYLLFVWTWIPILLGVGEGLYALVQDDEWFETKFGG